MRIAFFPLRVGLLIFWRWNTGGKKINILFVFSILFICVSVSTLWPNLCPREMKLANCTFLSSTIAADPFLRAFLLETVQKLLFCLSLHQPV